MEKNNPPVKFLKTELKNIKDKALLIGFFKDKLELGKELKAFDAKSNLIEPFIKDKTFNAEKGEVKNIYINILGLIMKILDLI